MLFWHAMEIAVDIAALALDAQQTDLLVALLASLTINLNINFPDTCGGPLGGSATGFSSGCFAFFYSAGLLLLNNSLETCSTQNTSTSLLLSQRSSCTSRTASSQLPFRPL